MAQKIERQELLNIFFRSMGGTPFHFIEGKNPFRIEYFGKEYYIYIKNLSSAHFSNPDVWRAQLPIREDFANLAEQDIDFIMFGYDADNEVYTCWNPTWVKQRLNKAESVSLYSRLSLQQEAAHTHQLKRLDLSNDGEVIAFPQEMISLVLMGIQNFFRNTGDYVAMGSKKRVEANQAYRIFSDAKNIPLFADYMSKEGKSQSTISTYCRCMKNLLNDNYITKYRKVFLACDSLNEYPSVVDEFFVNDDVKSMNDKSHMQYYAAMRAYIEYLTLGESAETEDETLPFDSSTEQTSAEPASTEKTKPTDFDVFCDLNTVHAFESYLGKKDYLHSTVRRYARAVEFLLKNGWIDRYKDLFTSCSSFAEYNKAADIFFKKPDVFDLNEQRHHDYSAGLRQYILYLITIDDRAIPEQISSETLRDVSIPDEETTEQPAVEENIDWEAEYTDANGKLTKIANPELLEKIRPFLDTEYQELTAALTAIDEFYRGRFANMQLFEWGKLISAIDWTQPIGQRPHPQVVRATPSRKRFKLKVEYPNGKVLDYDSVANTYVEVITDFYPELIAEMGIEHAGVNIVSTTLDDKYGKYQRPIDGGWYVMTNSPTEAKKRDIQTISDELGLDLKVSIISLDGGEFIPEQFESKESKGWTKVKITYPDGRVSIPHVAFEALVEVVKYAGPQRVRDLHLNYFEGEFICRKPSKDKYAKACKPVGDGWLVNTCSSSARKVQQIEEISNSLNLGIQAELYK